MSDVFRLLAGGGGGARFDKRRFADDVKIFTASPATDAPDASASSSSKAGSSSSTKLSLPAELDFFGGGAAQNKPAASKAGDAKGKGKAEPEAESSTAGEFRRALSDLRRRTDQHLPPAEPLTRATLGAFLKEYRLKLTGTDAPLPLASWAELSSRWSAPEWLAQAPAKAGFAAPTPVQCAASAVLLDVSRASLRDRSEGVPRHRGQGGALDIWGRRPDCGSQERTLIAVLQDRDLLAGAPTGSGKTMAYLIPLLHHLRGPKPGPVRALVVAPTRELATQIHDSLRKISGPRGVRACMLTKANEGNLKQGEGKKGTFGEQSCTELESSVVLTPSVPDVLITTPMRLVNALEANEVDLSA